MAFIETRIDTGDYDAWKPMFDLDHPAARRDALGFRIFRGVDNPNEVYIHIEFASVEHAEAARKRLVESGVLNRFGDTTGPTVVVEAEAIGY
jgi:hypothetical protein